MADVGAVSLSISPPLLVQSSASPSHLDGVKSGYDAVLKEQISSFIHAPYTSTQGEAFSPSPGLTMVQLQQLIPSRLLRPA